MNIEATPEELDGWEQPLPIGWRTGLPPFPADVLPPVLRRYVAEISAQIQTPVDMAGTAVLGVLAATIGGRVRISPRAGWSEPTNLYVVVVARPASRKSEVIKQCRRPLARAESRLRVAYGEEVNKKAAEREILEGRADKLKKAAMGTGDPDDIQAAQEAVQAAEQVELLAWPRLWTSDATPEALETLMAEQGGRIAGISAEAGLFEAFAGRHAKKSNIELLLEAHAGDERASDRQTRRGSHMEAPALTVVVSIQPFALHQMVDNDEYGGRGLLQRMLWSLTPDNVGSRTWEAPAASGAAVAAYETLLADIAVAAYGHKEVNELQLDDAAAKRLGEYYEQTEAKMHGEGVHGVGLIRDWAGKLVGATARIAAGIHVAQHPPQLDPNDRPLPWTPPRVAEETVEAAIALAEYYRVHADAALAPRKTESATRAGSLMAWLVSRDDRRVTVRDVQRGAPRKFRDSAEIAKKTLDDLAERGWCRPSPNGGWELHPHAKSLFERAHPGDSGDTCDNENKTAGQRVSRPASRVSHPPATSGDSGGTTGGSVATRRQGVRHPGDGANTAVTSENAESVAPVARVTTVCTACGRPLDPALAYRWHHIRLHPSCASGEADR